jgi:hypothetical protein
MHAYGATGDDAGPRPTTNRSDTSLLIFLIAFVVTIHRFECFGTVFSLAGAHSPRTYTEIALELFQDHLLCYR